MSTGNLEVLKEKDYVLLTYLGKNFDPDVIGTSVIGMVKKINTKSIDVEAISDNAPDTVITYDPGQIVNIDKPWFSEEDDNYIKLEIIGNNEST